MSEQQNDSVEQSTSETAPEQKEKVTFSEDQQAVIDKVGHQGRENVRIERQKTADLQARLDAAEAKVPKETRPDVVGNGDIYDENYEANRAARESQLVQQAKFDARQEFEVDQQKISQAATQQAEQQKFQDSLNKFNDSAAKFDINATQLQQMDQTVASHGGLRQDVGDRVLNDEQGMLVYRYLSENPDEIYLLNQMSQGDAAIHVSEIKAKATALYTKRTSNAPDPADNLSGSGVVPKVRGVGGTTYD